MYPEWLLSYERARPRELMELFGEVIGVFFYVSFGIGANLAFNITTAAKENGYGSLLNIAIAYGLGITFGVIVSGTTSGSHLSPGFTIAFALYKGFPWRKVPQYIVAQILGAFLAALLAYAQYGPLARQVVAGLDAAGLPAVNFTPAGIAGALSSYPTLTSRGITFLNEFVATTLLGILVFSVLDPSNLFIHFASAPWIIGFSYTGIILAFAVPTVVLNTARYLGGTFAAACIFGNDAFIDPWYVAIGTFTNIAGTLLGAAIQSFLLSDHRRVVLHHIPETHPGHPAYQRGNRGSPTSHTSALPEHMNEKRSVEHDGSV